MHNAAFLVATACVLVTGGLVALRLRLPSRLDALTAWALLCVAEVLATVLALGWIGALTTGWVFLTGLVVLVLVVGATTRGEHSRAAWAQARRQLAALRADLRWTKARQAPLALFLALLATAQVLWSTFVGWALPPTGYDTLTYHLPAVAYWIQRGQIVRTPYGVFTNVYPLNAEATFAWPAVLLHSDALVNLGQVPFALLGAAAVAIIARTVGVRRSGAVVAASLFLLTPVVAEQMAVAYVDVALVGMFLTALAFVLRAAQSLGVLGGDGRSQRRPRLAVAYLALAGIAAGIGAGSKESGLAYLAVLGLVAVGTLVAACVTDTLRPAAALRLLAVLVVPVVLLGSSWYLRNLVEHQNPLYPFNVELAGVVFEHGPQGSPNADFLVGQEPEAIRGLTAPAQLARSWVNEPNRRYNYDQRLGGLGLLWLIAAVPALVVFTIRCLRRRRDVLFLFLVPSFLVLLIQPSNWWSRFTLFFLGAGLVALASELEHLRRWNQLISRVVQLAIALVAFVTFGLVSYRIAVATPRVVLDHATESIDSRSAATALETNGQFDWLTAIPPKAAIATRLAEVEKGFVYPLFGRHFERPVVVLRGTGTESLLRQLRDAANVRYVLTRAGHPLDRALRSAPDDFHLVRRVGSQRIYRVG